MYHVKFTPAFACCILAALLLPPAAPAANPAPLPPVPALCTPKTEMLSAGALRELVEADWLQSLKTPLTTQSDAAGACDGVKNGTYGFHTGQEARPWWQVDLGQNELVTRIVVYNRLDYAPGLHNADTVQLTSSLDGEHWTLLHDNQGRHFGGVNGDSPLEVALDTQTAPFRFLRLTIPSAEPIFLHLDEVEVYAAGDPAKNIALGKPANQSSLSPWSTAKVHGAPQYPVSRHIERGRALAARLAAQGMDVSSSLQRLEAVAGRLEQTAADAPEETRRALYLDARWAVRGLVLSNPLLDFDRLLFVKRFTQETYPDVCLNHMPWVSRPGGDICVLEPSAEGGALFSALAEPAQENPDQPVAAVRSLLNRALGPGHVHGIDLWFGGDRVVFGYARARGEEPPEGWLDRTQSYRLRRAEEPIHLYELQLTDGALRQLTFGEWSDLDPTYAPNGDIVFVSERCGTSLQCNEYDKDETSCNLYVIRPDGSGIRRLSANKDGDYLPHCLDNGMIAYTRWEYHERSWAYIQSIWVVRPDGTGADALFKQHFVNPWALEEARSIPNSGKLVAIAAGHHTLPVGPLVLVTHGMGVNEPRGMGIITPGLLPPEGGMDGVPVPQGGTDDQDGFYGTPWALSEECFLVCYTHGSKTTEPTGYSLYLVDVYGNKELVYRDSSISSFYPIPLRPRPVPTALPETMNTASAEATCYVTNIAQGSPEVPPEKIRYLRIAEPIGWPYDNENGGQRYGEDHRYGGPGAERKNLTNWTPVRILGDVPVRADGSVHFRVPADTAVYFQLLDENRMELRRMRSFISFQPGELRGCVGCHETRASAPASPANRSATALASRPDPLILPPWGDRPVSFLRDVQPVLNRHCTRCHAGLAPAGELDFSGGLIAHDEEVPGYGHNRAFETMLANNLLALAPARAQDASITPPFAYGAHKSRLIAALTDAKHAERVDLSEEDRLRLVLWVDANGPYHDRFVNKRAEKRTYDPAADRTLLGALREIHGRRCVSCHEVDKVTRLDWIDLERPERSLFLTAPLSESAGGRQRCGQTVYVDRNDPDYREAQSLVFAASAKAWENPRRDLAALNRPAWSHDTGPAWAIPQP